MMQIELQQYAKCRKQTLYATIDNQKSLQDKLDYNTKKYGHNNCVCAYLKSAAIGTIGPFVPGNRYERIIVL